MSDETKIYVTPKKTNEKEQLKLIENFQENGASTFEDAIIATGFGKFNYILMFCLFFPCATQLTETVSISYVLPVAECDLGLSLEDKGMLNGAAFAGMIASGPFWGYLCDALGRKQIIIYGYLGVGFFSTLAAVSPNQFLLITAKLISGFILNGPYAAVTSHITEFHAAKYRGRMTMIRGMFISVMNLLLPVMAWLILSSNFNIKLFGLLELHSWNIFLLTYAMNPILSGIFYMFLPESPKFLMSIGRNKEALEVMRKVYATNTKNPPNSFPIKRLTEETEQNMSSKKDLTLALKEGFSEVKSFFQRPHNKNLALACFNAFSLVMGLNTLKLWLPGIFQAITDYQKEHNGTSASMCSMLEQMSQTKNLSSTNTCTVNLDNVSVYINSFIVASTRVGVFIVAGTFIKCLGLIKLNIILCWLSASLMFSIYFANSSTTVTVLSAIGSSIGSIPENLLVGISLELFPTTLRTMALSIHLTFGRLGTLIGNLIFPYLMYLGCLPPFLFIGIFTSACGFLSLLYPNIDNKPLQ